MSRVVTGLLASTEGAIRLGGRSITGLPAYKIAGPARPTYPEGRGVFANLTVEERPQVGVPPSGGGRQSVPSSLEKAYAAFPVLGERRRRERGDPVGGRAAHPLAGQGAGRTPRLLVADEISLGLAPVMIDAVYDGLRKINAAGTALLIVEQQVDRVLEIASTAVVLEHGSVAYCGNASGALAAVERVLASRGERTVRAADPQRNGSAPD